MVTTKRLALLITACLAVSGCSAGSGTLHPTTFAENGDFHPITKTLTSLDGRSAVPARNKIKCVKARKKKSRTIPSGSASPGEDDSPKESELDALKPYSVEWWSVRDAIDRASETKLAKKLIICRDCMPPKVDDQTGSIGSN